MVGDQIAKLALITGAMTFAAAGVTGCGTTGSELARAPVTASLTTTPTLPPMRQFRIGYPEGPVQDCSIEGAAVDCTLSVAGPSSVEAYSGTATGTLSGLTFTGVSATHQRFRDEGDHACMIALDKTEPVHYVFSLDGTVTMHGGPAAVHTTRTGSCSGSESGTGERWESSAPWRATG